MGRHGRRRNTAGTRSPRRRATDAPAGCGRVRLRDLVRGPGPGIRDGHARARRDVADHVRRVGAVRGGLGAGRRGRRGRGGGRRRPPERPLRPDRRERRPVPHRPLVVALPARPAHRRRVLGHRCRGRGSVQHQGAGGSRPHHLRRVARGHGCRRGVRGPDRRPEPAGARRGLPSTLPGVAGSSADLQGGAAGGGPGCGDRPGAHALHPAGVPIVAASVACLLGLRSAPPESRTPEREGSA